MIFHHLDVYHCIHVEDVSSLQPQPVTLQELFNLAVVAVGQKSSQALYFQNLIF